MRARWEVGDGDGGGGDDGGDDGDGGDDDGDGSAGGDDVTADSAELVRFERRGAVALLTLNRPAALNALSSAVLRALEARVDEVERSREVRAVVVTGAGRAFAAGADIAEMRGFSTREAEAFSRLAHEVFAKLEALPVPVIAAVNGFAFGGGCELALACDWVYASADARFGQPEVKLGLLPGFGGSSRLPRQVGPAWAAELVLSGEPVDAALAARIGLVNRVFDDADATLEGALESARAVSQKGPLAVANAKRVMQHGQDADLRAANTLEQQAFSALFASEECALGMDAFLKKREPKFPDR